MTGESIFRFGTRRGWRGTWLLTGSSIGQLTVVRWCLILWITNLFLQLKSGNQSSLRTPKTVRIFRSYSSETNQTWTLRTEKWQMNRSKNGAQKTIIYLTSKRVPILMKTKVPATPSSKWQNWDANTKKNFWLALQLKTSISADQSPNKNAAKDWSTGGNTTRMLTLSD